MAWMPTMQIVQRAIGLQTEGSPVRNPGQKLAGKSTLQNKQGPTSA